MKNAVIFAIATLLLVGTVQAQDFDFHIPANTYLGFDDFDNSRAEEIPEGQSQPSTLKITNATSNSFDFKMRLKLGTFGPFCTGEGKATYDGRTYVNKAFKEGGCTIYFQRGGNQIFVDSQGPRCNELCGNGELRGDFRM